MVGRGMVVVVVVKGLRLLFLDNEYIFEADLTVQFSNIYKVRATG